ncbi:MAG: hypothetical protein IAF38_10615 [Bacteroidia bacterium]|nr:hypothetical protein [Bacteroidia bacterium]
MKKLFVILSFVFFSCTEDKNTSTNAEINPDILEGEFISITKENKDSFPELLFSFSGKDFTSLNENRGGLDEKIDTLVLNYMAYACDCPQWADTAYLKFRDSIFIINAHSYYLEQGSLKLPDFFSDNPWNKVKFIGRFYKGRGFPIGSSEKFIDPNPPKGKVFRFYSYEYIYPIKIYREFKKKN